MDLENLAISKGKDVGCVVAEAPKPAEKTLVEAAKAGQATAFAALYERYAQQLLRAAHRVTRNHEDSEDAVQDALLSAFVHLRDFDGRSSFATWLTRIAINSALMILRKKRNSLESAIGDTEEFGAERLGFEIADRAPNPERRYAQSEEKGIVRKAIESLRPTLREVVKVQHLQERSVRETAKALCVTTAAAKGRLFHAKAALRRSPILKFMHQRRVGREFRVLSAA